jgi:hypothetical protein
MKALSVLFNFPYPKIWIHISRYENTTFTRQNLTVLWRRRRRRRSCL